MSLLIPALAGAAIQDIRVANHTQAAVTISWITDSETIGAVQYSEFPDLSNAITVYDTRGQTFEGCTHYVEVSGLTKETSYYFKIVSGEDADDNGGSYYTFSTMKEPFSPPGPCSVYGYLYLDDNTTPAENGLVSLWITHAGIDSYPLSAIVAPNGSFVISIMEARNVMTNDLFFSITIGEDPIHVEAVYCDGYAVSSNLVFNGCSPPQNFLGSMTLTSGSSSNTTTSSVPPVPVTIPTTMPSTVPTTIPASPPCTDAECDDGLFCNGVESCDEVNDECVSSGAPCPDDGLFCTGTESCDEVNDTCTHSGNPCLDDGRFCTGEEGCNEENDTCLHSGNPCSEGTTCSEETAECMEKPASLEINLIPDSALQSHLLPLPLIMFIEGIDTHFNQTTSITFNDFTILPPLYLVLSPTSVLVVSLINPAGLAATTGNAVTIMVSSTVDTGTGEPYEEVASESLTLNLLPFIFGNDKSW
jgi:hypothetical protein